MISRTMALLIKHNRALEEKRKIYEYGLNLLYSSLLTMSGTILIYSVFGYFNEIVFIMLFFGFLRTFAGGYHARNRISCFTIFVLLSGGVIWLSYNVSLELYAKVLAYGLLLCVLFVGIASPLDTRNKLLKEKQKRDYKKKSILIVLCQSLIIFGLYIMSYDTWVLLGIFSIYAVVLTMALRIIQKRVERRNSL